MIEIQNVTGHTPAIIGCDYAAGWATGPPPSQIDYSCNPYLKDHSNKNGLVQVENHFPNPVFPDGGGLKNKSDLVFTDLLKPETDTGKRWKLYLDVVAEGLNDLQQANVTALYRPFHEMNGGWFWWGAQVRQCFILIQCWTTNNAFVFRILRIFIMYGNHYLIIFVMKKIYIIFSGYLHRIKVLQLHQCITQGMIMLILLHSMSMLMSQ